MTKTASTREIIEHLEAYEKSYGVGSVESIGTVCAGSRDVEYVFHVADKNGKETSIEIPTLKKETLWDLMYPKSETENEQDILLYVKEGYFVHDDHIDYLELSNVDFGDPMNYQYYCRECEDDGIPYYIDFSQEEVSKYILTLKAAKEKLLNENERKIKGVE